MMNMSIPNQDNEVPEDDALFSSYEEQESFIRNMESRHSLTRRIEEDAELSRAAALEVIDEFDFALPDASSFSLFANWQLHPNGTHVYGYRIRGLGGFSNEETTPAGNGVYLSMGPWTGGAGWQTAGRHAFSLPKHPFVVINEPVYLKSNHDLLLEPIHRDDTLWLKLNKAATLRTYRLKKGKWDALAIGDLLTHMLWKAGYDSIYFHSSSRSWVVLLMPGRPFASKPSGQSNLSKSQPVQAVIDASFESREIRRVGPEGAVYNDDRGIYGWPSDETQLERATLECFFAQDWLDGDAVAFATVSCPTCFQSSDELAKLVQGLVEVESTGFSAETEVSFDLASLPEIEVDSNGLKIGHLEVTPLSFEDAEWDETMRYEWFWNGQPLSFDPSFFYDPPRGMACGEWQKVIRESDYIRRHTSHPWASSRSVADAMNSVDHEDFVEWLLMLPDEHLQNLGLLEQSLEWIEHERRLQKMRP